MAHEGSDAAEDQQDGYRAFWQLTIGGVAGLVLVLLILSVLGSGDEGRSAEPGLSRLEARFEQVSGLPLEEGLAVCQRLRDYYGLDSPPTDVGELIRADLVRAGYAHSEARALHHHATDNLCSITGNLRDP